MTNEYVIVTTHFFLQYKTVGQPLLLGDEYQSKTSVPIGSPHKLCCACESSTSMDTQNPATLLQNEYSSHSLHSALLDSNSASKNNGITFTVKKDKCVSSNNRVEEV